MKFGCRVGLRLGFWGWQMWVVALIAVPLMHALPAAAQTISKVPPRLPPTAITLENDSSDSASSPVTPALAAATTTAAGAIAKEAPYTGPVDSAQATLQIKQDTWAYSHPDRSSTRLEQMHAGKYVNVTGTTHYFARVKLKNGEVGFVQMSALDLARPTDKIFRLTRDTPVLSSPTRYGSKLAQVHNGHDVHVIGTSMNYMKIRMKDGLEGYIASSALE